MLLRSPLSHPHSSRSMRDIGYSLGTALADIIDNSIAAQAETIQVFAEQDPLDPKVGILDDGNGMAEAELLEAMRLGESQSSRI